MRLAPVCGPALPSGHGVRVGMECAATPRSSRRWASVSSSGSDKSASPGGLCADLPAQFDSWKVTTVTIIRQRSAGGD